MKIKEILTHLENKFPLYLQEDFDNCGVQCGNVEQPITGALICFEMSDKVIDEAIENNANLVISHHPLMLKNGIRKIEPNNRVGRIICKALEYKMVLYSMHTNIDCAQGGGNDVFADILELKDLQVLDPVKDMYRKLVFFVPRDHTDEVKNALLSVGCGVLGNYDHCSYTMQGIGTFRPLQGAVPFIGHEMTNELVEENRVEMVFPAILQRKVIETLYQSHPYEEPAFDILRLENPSRTAGIGRVGTLTHPMKTEDFLLFLKQKLNLQVVRYYGNKEKMIQKVAICGGGGASFIEMAMASGADAYVTGDIKYHDFFKADDNMLIADVGHYESEHFIKEIIYKEVKENFTTFATAISKMDNLEICFI